MCLYRIVGTAISMCVVCVCVLLLQSGMYAALMEKVDSFRSLIGAPDVERFNIVLLGGPYIPHHITKHYNITPHCTVFSSESTISLVVWHSCRASLHLEMRNKNIRHPINVCVVCVCVCVCRSVGFPLLIPPIPDLSPPRSNL